MRSRMRSASRLTGQLRALRRLHLLRRMDRKPCSPCRDAARPGFPWFSRRDPDGAGAWRGCPQRPRAEEGRQRGDAGARWARSPSGQCQGRRVLSGAAARRTCRRRRKSETRARHRRSSLVRWVGDVSVSRISNGTTNSWRCDIRDEYPFNEGRLVSNRGIDIDIADYETEFEERHVAHSTALHSVVKRRGAYLVGPLARYALNFDHLPASVQALAREAGLGAVCRNPFQSIIVRAIEIVYACEEALRVIAAYEPPAAAALPIEARAGIGFGCTEAPRGICWHRYEFEADGTIRSRAHRAADLAEPAEHRSGPCGGGHVAARPIRRRHPRSLRADYSQLRSVHFLFHPLSQAVGASDMSGTVDQGIAARKVMVIGIGNRDRGDDGIGAIVAESSWDDYRLTSGSSLEAATCCRSSTTGRVPTRWYASMRLRQWERPAKSTGLILLTANYHRSSRSRRATPSALAKPSALPVCFNSHRGTLSSTRSKAAVSTAAHR